MTHDPNPQISVLAEGLQFPEGPIWMSDGSILLVEIAAQTLTRIDAGGKRHVVAQLRGGPNGAALGPDGAVYICNNGGFAWSRADGFLKPVGPANDYAGGWIERVDLATGRSERLFSDVNGIPLSGPNDIVFDRQGGFWFTDHGKKHARHMDLGAVFYSGAAGVWQSAFPLLGPNGIGLSPDESTLYVAETPTGRLWAYDISSPGTLAELNPASPTGGRLVCGLPAIQRYDSLAVEEDGTISVANLRDGAIISVDPQGNLIRRLNLDDPYTTNICFGGPDRRTAFITLSGSGRLISLRWPSPGLPINFSV